MSLTAPQTTHAAPLSAQRRWPAPLLVLVAGTVALAVGRAATTRGGSAAERLDQMAGQGFRVTASTLLVVAGFTAIVPGLWFVASTVRRRGAFGGRGARLATTGSWLVLVGSVGFSVLASVDLATLAATHVPDQASMTEYLHQLDVSPGIVAVTAPALVGYFIGPFLITLGARRSGIGPKWLSAAVLVSLVLQPVGAALGGPPVASVADVVLQLGLVVTMVLLAREVVAASSGTTAA
ncbi:MAG TPA: hypothetical protein VFX00_03735 [Pedococcus sp.]|jgi:hypothetical protein|nr:hypothetical protein [Pedococcus sp.]